MGEREENDETRRFEVPEPPSGWGYPYGPPGHWGYPAAPAPEPPRRRRLRGCLLTGFAVVGVFSVVLGVTYGLVRGGRADGARVAPDGGGVTSPATAVATDVQGAISNWYRDGGRTRMTDLVNDMSAVSVDADSLKYTAVVTDCGRLRDDVDAARGYGPIPDAQSQQHWSAALTHLRAASTACVRGAGDMDTNQMLTAASQMDAASAEMVQVTDRIRQLGDTSA